MINQLKLFYKYNHQLELDKDYWSKLSYTINNKKIKMSKTFNILPQPKANCKFIILDKCSLGYLFSFNNYQKESNNQKHNQSIPMDKFFHLKRVGLNNEKGKKFTISTISTNSVTLNLTLMHRQRKNEIDKNKSEANKSLNKTQGQKSPNKEKSKKNTNKSKRKEKQNSYFYLDLIYEMNQERYKEKQNRKHPDEIFSTSCK